MIKTTYFNKTLGENVTKHYIAQDYVKSFKCPTCEICVVRSMFNNHKKTSEYHKIAEKIRMAAPEPIDDIRHAIIKYKIVKKYMEKTLSNNESTSSEEMDERYIEHKTNLYVKELDKKTNMYELKDLIPRLVHKLNIEGKLLTKQKIKFFELLNKYPNNESLLSVKHLVPEIVIKPPKEPKIKETKIKEPKIKHVKKKSKNIEKVYPIIKYEPIIPSNILSVSYPIIKYEDTTQNNNNNISYPIIKYEDIQPTRKTVYEIIKYE